MNIARTAKRGRLRLAIPALVMAIAALIIPLGETASARTTTGAAASDGLKPSIVLEHEAWVDTSSWNGVIKRLQAEGYTVHAPPNPLQGLSYDSAFLADFPHSISGPIVCITQSSFPSCMANGLPVREAPVLAVTQLPIATSALGDPSGVPAWQTIPSWAVVGTADHAIPPGLQLAMAENAHARVTEVHAPHLSMISDPGVVTSVILQAVHATS